FLSLLPVSVVGHAGQHRKLQVSVHVFLAVHGGIHQHPHNQHRTYQHSAQQAADDHIFSQTGGHILHSLRLGIINNSRLAAADDLVDLIHADIQQGVGNIPAQFQVIAGNDDLNDMGGIRIVHLHQFTQFLVI